jgi:hypothetical protein
MDKQGRERLLAERFGEIVEASYCEETDANMVVHVDLARLDRIVSVKIADPLLVAN